MNPNNPSSARPAIIEDIRASIRGIRMPPPVKQKPGPPDFSEARRLFTVCTGNRWMELGERMPPQKRLFGDFWHQNELCILFAAANAGKSILAVQIADALSRGRSAAPFAPRLRLPLKVLYIDFELSTTQFRTRYSRPSSAYSFSDNFFRAQFNADPSLCPDPARYDDFVLAGIRQLIELVQATVLIIDNISCLRGGTENASVALRLMQNLKALQAGHNLSILLLAHTPKRRSLCRPPGADDLHGSKLLINFADSAFTIGSSHSQSGLCYLKQIKQRNTEQVYGENNVCLCRIARRRDSFLHFKFEGYSAEAPHLPGPIARNQSLAAKAAALHARGLSQRLISKKLRISLGRVNELVRIPIAIGTESPKVRKTGRPKVGKMEDDVQIINKKSHPQPGWGPHHTGGPPKGSPMTGSQSPDYPSPGDLAREVPNQVGDDDGVILTNRDDVPRTCGMGWADVQVGDRPSDRHCGEQPVPTKLGKVNRSYILLTKRVVRMSGVRLIGSEDTTGPLNSVCSADRRIVPRNNVLAVDSG